MNVVIDHWRKWQLSFVILLTVWFIICGVSANIPNASTLLYLPGNNSFIDYGGSHTIYDYNVSILSNSGGGSCPWGSGCIYTNGGFLMTDQSDFTLLHTNNRCWTLSFSYYRHTAQATNEVIIDDGGLSSNNIGIIFYYTPTNNYRMLISNGSGVFPYNTFSSKVQPTNPGWSNLSLTFDPTLSSNNYKLYINGSLDTSGSPLPTAIFNQNKATSFLHIGSSRTNTSLANFTIDDFRIRNISMLQPTVQDTEFIANPTASFTQSSYGGTTPLTVTFTNTSIGNVGDSSLQWYITNSSSSGGNGTLINIGSGYTQSATLSTGNWSILLTDINSFGISNANSWVNVTPVPLVPAFIVNTTSGIAPLAVSFTDSTTGSPTAWYWNTTNGGTGVDSTNQNIIVTYNVPGIYSINLTVSNMYETKTLIAPNLISVFYPEGPLSNFTSTSTTGYLPLNVQFTDISTSPNPILSWLWEFGNGDTSAVQNPFYTYTSPGLYTVNLTVTTISGSSKISVPGYIKAEGPEPGVIPVESNINLAFTICGIALVALAMFVVVIGAYLISRPTITKKEQQLYNKVIMSGMVVVIIGFVILGIGMGTLGPMLIAMGG